LIRAGGGSILSSASVQTFQGLPNFIAYSGTKGAIYSMTIAMAKDLARYNIRVNCICPGAVNTPINDRLFAEQPDPEAARRAAAKLHALGRMGDPVEVAYAAVYLASNESTWVTGVALPVDGGFLTNPASI
jgi:NAD(P)-dependent dehydrogenase (short-subunit alcohol dehydrogenase family)